MREYRRILLEGQPSVVKRKGERRHAKGGRSVAMGVEGLGRLENELAHGPAPMRVGFGAQPTSSEKVISTALGGDWEFRGIRAPRGPGVRHYESRLDD